MTIIQIQFLVFKRRKATVISIILDTKITLFSHWINEIYSSETFKISVINPVKFIISTEIIWAFSALFILKNWRNLIIIQTQFLVFNHKKSTAIWVILSPEIILLFYWFYLILSPENFKISVINPVKFIISTEII